ESRRSRPRRTPECYALRRSKGKRRNLLGVRTRRFAAACAEGNLGVLTESRRRTAIRTLATSRKRRHVGGTRGERKTEKKKKKRRKRREEKEEKEEKKKKRRKRRMHAGARPPRAAVGPPPGCENAKEKCTHNPMRTRRETKSAGKKRGQREKQAGDTPGEDAHRRRRRRAQRKGRRREDTRNADAPLETKNGTGTT
ncbi:hypothetical protein TGP89_419940, partial [Toxoplasma gondii p89]